MSFNNVGKVFTPNSLKVYLKDIGRPSWIKAVCVHHCAEPSLKQRPVGFTAKHIENLQYFYQKELKWSSGPHFFIDEDQIFGMTPLTEKGVHAVSFNSSAIGIEVLGDYDTESPFVGRGAECWDTTASTVKVLLEWLGLPANDKTVLFHRDDPKTSKTCPGKLITRDWFIRKLSNTKVAVPTISTPAPKPLSDMVVVTDYFVKQKIPYNTVISNLTSKANKFYWKGEWLEHAYYDNTMKATVAPVADLVRFNTVSNVVSEVAVLDTPTKTSPSVETWVDKLVQFFKQF